MFNSVKTSDRKYFHIFVEEYPEYTELYTEWFSAYLGNASPDVEFRLADKLYNLMLKNGWG